tara:strand:+ start:3477 stop:3824 length:348 start_codon:yes stop_codon:yes gene_type:complete
MPSGRNRDPSRRRYKYATSLEKKAYWTTPVPEGTPKPGPKKRSIVYREALDKVINSSFMNEWCTSDQIAYEANKYISNHWTQLSTYSVCAILRTYEKDNKISVQKKEKKYYRKNI